MNGFNKNYTIILDQDNNKFTIKLSHHPKSISVQSYYIIPKISIPSPILLQIIPTDTLYDPINVEGLDSSKIKEYTMIIDSLPSSTFPHQKYGLIFSDPCIVPSTMSSRVCARYTHNQYYIEFKVNLKNIDNTNIEHNLIILQLLIETY